MYTDLLEKRTHIAALFDIYAPLLTDKQREAIRLCYDEDCSLSEIAEIFDSSRQAAADLLKRTVSALEHYEDLLGLAAAADARHAALALLKQRIDEGHAPAAEKAELLAILQSL